jgi:hypothetical protein
MRKLLLAFDPGLATGIALFDLEKHELVLVDSKAADIAVTDMWNLIWAQKDNLEIAYERYIISQHTLKLSAQYEPLEVIGAIRFAAEPLGIPFTGYTSSESKHFGTDAKLRKLKLSRPGPDHVRDATRIALLHIAKKHPDVLKAMYAVC